MKVVEVNAKGGTPPVHPDHELSPEEEVRYSELFGKLDVDGDGRINVDDLQEGLVRMGVHMVPNHAEKFMSKSDQNKDGHLDFSEFVRYVTEHEKQLHIVFKSVDHNQDGAIDVDEILLSLKKLGVSVSKEEADRLLKSMDKDGTLKVDWNEWRNYLLLHPSSDLRDIYAYWRHATFLDIGEDVMVPDEFTEQERQTGMWWRILAAGGAAGAVSRTVTAPLDRLKVILQVIGSKKPNIGILDGFKHMYREGGFKSFWRGNGINVIKIAPESAIKFLAYERIKRLLHTEGTELKVYERFVAGALAGVVAQTTIYPMEVLKTRLAIRKTGQYKGILDCAVQIYKKEGFRCFYRGYIPNCLGIIPYAGIDLAVYETVKNSWIRNHQDSPVPNIAVLLGCGTVSSTCGQLASYPLALVRTRLQAQTSKTITMGSLFTDIIKTEGVKGLYRGITPNFMKVIPAVSIGYVVYENTKTLLGVKAV
ncbi:calcium-binding mitochondrial carrier protein SCaMC-2 isoform X4 [Strongylocentrotus purpuratus]|uniref:EF-hand domain-containing protein n=1 Tax=Strongylocentrotus purpuratus TaxID=7668 RepID=A0A7M7HLY2_STRPU|nr:calcium-binding mitochondrial carrier protein SCaMC-2 isoform X4 [Strongylocentrotus purpuratus]